MHLPWTCDQCGKQHYHYSVCDTPQCMEILKQKRIHDLAQKICLAWMDDERWLKSGTLPFFWAELAAKAALKDARRL